MADTQQLTQAKAFADQILSQLRATAGPRGATYQARVLTSQDTPESIAQRSPVGDVEEYGTMALPAAGALGAGMTKAQIKAGLRPIEEELAAMESAPVRTGGQRISKAQLQAGVRQAANFAQIAKAGEVPSVPPTRMWPAWINEQTGEVSHATQVITSGWHVENTPKIYDSRYKMLVPDPNWTRGHVDPNTFKAYTDAMLDAVSKGATGIRKWFGAL